MNFLSERKEILKILCFVIVLASAVYFQSGSISTILQLMSIAIFLLLNCEKEVVCILCQTLITDSLMIVPGLSYTPVLIGLFLVKGIFSDDIKHVFSGAQNKQIICIIIFVQLFSIVTFNNDIVNVFRLIFNLVVLLFFSNFSFNCFQKRDTIPVSIAITVLLGCVISNFRSYSVDNLGVLRFSGIWNDENFCGMYGLMGVVSAAFAYKYDKKNLVVAVPTVLAVMYIELLSMSRTYIYVLALLTLYFLYYIYNNKNVKSVYKFLLIIVLAIGAYYFFIKIVFPISEARGLTSTKDSDWTSGRATSSLNSLYTFIDEPISWLLGFGILNSTPVKVKHGFHALASHNTYVDFLVEYGLILFVVFISRIVKYCMRFVKKRGSIGHFDYLCLIVLIYMATLTMGQYTIMYIIGGHVLFRLRNNNEIQRI